MHDELWIFQTIVTPSKFKYGEGEREKLALHGAVDGLLILQCTGPEYTFYSSFTLIK